MSEVVAVAGRALRCDPSRLDDEKSIESVLDIVTEKAKMKILGRGVIRVEPSESDDLYADSGGVSGHIIWSTSGAMIHTWPLRQEAQFIFHSCKPFNLEDVREAVSVAFRSECVGVYDISWTMLAEPIGEELVIVSDFQRLQEYRSLFSEIADSLNRWGGTLLIEKIRRVLAR